MTVFCRSSESSPLVLRYSQEKTTLILQNNVPFCASQEIIGKLQDEAAKSLPVSLMLHTEDDETGQD